MCTENLQAEFNNIYENSLKKSIYVENCYVITAYGTVIYLAIIPLVYRLNHLLNQQTLCCKLINLLDILCCCFNFTEILTSLGVESKGGQG